MIVMMIVVLARRSCVRKGLNRGLHRRMCAGHLRWRVLRLRGNPMQRHSARGAKLVYLWIGGPACQAGVWTIGVVVVRGRRGVFHIHLLCQAMDGFKRRPD